MGINTKGPNPAESNVTFLVSCPENKICVAHLLLSYTKPGGMMALNEAMSRPVRELIDRVTEEVDTEQLRELILAINVLLDAIQNQREKLEGGAHRTH
jgi:hypothetical protein